MISKCIPIAYIVVFACTMKCKLYNSLFKHIILHVQLLINKNNKFLVNGSSALVQSFNLFTYFLMKFKLMVEMSNLIVSSIQYFGLNLQKKIVKIF